MAEPQPLVESITALTHYFVGDSSVADTLARVVDLSCHTIEPAHCAGITMVVDGRVGTHVSTDPTMAVIDEAQYEADDGPCLHAFRCNAVVVIDSTPSSTQWRHFCDTAVEHGVLSTLSVPMTASNGTIGALNFYSRTESAFTADDVGRAFAFATEGAFLLSNTQAYWDARNLGTNLRIAMESRAEIEQAKGIIIAATGCSPEQAFAQLRAQSQHQNVKLREIAAQIVSDAQRHR